MFQRSVVDAAVKELAINLDKPNPRTS